MIGDYPPVTPPPHGLGAHQRQPPSAHKLVQLREGVGELLAQRVVGVVVEAPVLPPSIDFERNCATDGATTGKPLNPVVVNAGLGERGLQSVPVEMRVPVRARQLSNINEHLDPLPLY